MLPQSWKAPHWHPDYGDPAAELEHLRALARAIQSGIHPSRLELEVPEPGLMLLHVRLPSGTLVEVYSVKDGSRHAARRYGVFVSPDGPNESEFYSECIDETVAYLTSMSRIS